MKKQLKYNPKSLKSRSANSTLISGSSYVKKTNLSQTYNSEKILKTIDLGNGYHTFIDNLKK